METEIQVKERPILFSTSMVKAILDERKTVTRRVMKPQLSCDHSGYSEADWKNKPIQWSEIGLKYGKAYCACCGNGAHLSDDWSGLNCPYGKPVDILWVRETWIKINIDEEFGGYRSEYAYRADDNEEYGSIKNGLGKRFIDSWKWRPSIFMPKAACRLKLQIVSVGVERLQDITEEDAIREGIELKYPRHEYHISDPGRQLFFDLWSMINGVDSTNANPWVWRIEFKKL